MKLQKTFLIAVLSLTTFVFCNLFAQDQTVGLFLNDEQSFNGYTLFSPMRSTMTYLINNEGREVHSWNTGNYSAQSVYLSENGNLLHTANPFGNNVINAGGAGGLVQEINWDGNLVWSYELNNEQYRLHHDIEVLPNGNILMIAWENKTTTEAINQGRNPDNLNEEALWPDFIIEIEPDGEDGENIVWEWHAWDHLIQDYDNSKPNYGVVSEHPELIDLNYASSTQQLGIADWLHTNSIDYNEEFDQIILSIHNFSEIWIIDHSTTTEEATNHIGGNSGKGGDLLYRWGNPQAYNSGTSEDRKLYGQHDALWIEEGCPGEGNITIYNNGTCRPTGNYSTVDEIISPVDESGNYELPAAGESFAPSEQIWVYQAENPTDFYSQNISGSQRLLNGNTLICEGQTGTFFELTDSFEIVWIYVNPVAEQGPLHQNETIPSGQGGQENSVFKIRRYSPEFAGFDGIELIPGDFIELPAENPENPNFSIVDTGLEDCYDNLNIIAEPLESDAFYGQDAQYEGNQPSYTDNEDGTITDNVTGLMWQKSPDLNGDNVINADDKLSYPDALSGADDFDLAGYIDWRLPTIKEIYSLILFSGIDCSSYQGTETDGLVPFIDTDYFDFGYGDTSAGERIIDAQFASNTIYVAETMNGNETMFGVNFADGRIKGYPAAQTQNGEFKKYYVLYVRANESYGINDFIDNNDGTIPDNATGLMWSQNDSNEGLNWEEALAWVQLKNAENYQGYNDWRLPNVKELQSIIDYTRSPDTSNSAALDQIFNITSIINAGGESDYPYFWSSTTHRDTNNGRNAAYVAFGEALGWMEIPPSSGNYTLMDVHGAGAQRSEVKEGNPEDYPYGHGPQGDVVRIYNYVRLVRDLDPITGINNDEIDNSATPGIIKYLGNYPNPFNPTTIISFEINTQSSANVELTIFNLKGQKVKTLIDEPLSNGNHSITWNGNDSNNNKI